MKTKTAKQVLNEVKKVIDRGWCRLQNYKKINGKDHYCLSGAFNVVRGKMPRGGSFDQVVSREAEIDKAMVALSPLILQHGYIGIIAFNDGQKDKRQVIALINRAINTL